jgi:alkylation response protein AidB-like acyl-CoA dehydrogenase
MAMNSTGSQSAHGLKKSPREYAVKRQAFGRPLIEHEGVGFMLADNAIELRQATHGATKWTFCRYFPQRALQAS